MVWAVKSWKWLPKTYSVKNTGVKLYKLTFPIFLSCCINVMFYLERQKQLRDIEISKILIQFYKYVIYEACNKELKPSVLGGSNRQLFLTTMFKKLIEVSCGNMKATTQS